MKNILQAFPRMILAYLYFCFLAQDIHNTKLGQKESPFDLVVNFFRQFLLDHPFVNRQHAH